MNVLQYLKFMKHVNLGFAVTLSYLLFFSLFSPLVSLTNIQNLIGKIPCCQMMWPDQQMKTTGQQMKTTGQQMMRPGQQMTSLKANQYLVERLHCCLLINKYTSQYKYVCWRMLVERLSRCSQQSHKIIVSPTIG